jgi:hypothetical protein
VEREVAKEVGFARPPIPQQENGTRLGEKLALNTLQEFADLRYRLAETPARGNLYPDEFTLV